MQKGTKKPQVNIFLQILELLGKPFFLLLTLLLTGTHDIYLLGESIIRAAKLIKIPKINLPHPKVKPAVKAKKRGRKPKHHKSSRISLWISAVMKKIRYIKVPRIKGPKKSKKRGRKPKNTHKRVSRKIVGIVILGMIIVSITIYWTIFRGLPSVSLLATTTPSLTTKIYDRNGILLYQIYKDQNRSLIHLTDLPPYIIQATLAAEDKNFYHHIGFDALGIIRAAYNNLRCKAAQQSCSPEGGSTITQQLIKNTLLTPEKSLSRKLKELVLAVETEHAYTKDQILEMYLNQVGYGGTAYGIEEAAHQYFGKSARDLSLAESAMIVGLPISPTTLSPFGTNPYLGKIRQQQVLESMVKGKTITENQKIEALNTPLVFHAQDIAIRAPHFVMYVKDLLVKKYGEDLVNRGGLNVTTTLDLTKQDILQTQINEELGRLQKLHVQNGAGLIIAPKTGDILAMVGSHDFFDNQHDGQVNITLQKRQPGSSIKPITYTLALMQGATPNSYIDDAPVCFVLKGQPDYCPKNYDGRFHGRVTLRTALGSSYNIPAIKLLNMYGLSNMINLARQMGITTWDDPSRFGLSLTLGGGEITMLDLASVYSVLANGGEKVPLNAIMSVTDHTGKNITPDTLEKRQVIPATIAYQMSAMLSDAGARAPAFGTHSVLNLPGSTVAVKTGTTNDLRDNWTFGYTPDILVGTWVGNNDNSPMSSVASGITGASPIWAHTMQQLLKSTPATPFIPPVSMIKVNLSCNGIPKYDYFVPGNTPKIDCSATPSGTLLNNAASTAR